jgi:site-specific DNA recombinase
MTRCAIYARYSSDLQRAASIEDQVRRCQEFALRQGWSVVATYADHAISGAAMTGRHDLQKLILATRQKPAAFDRVLVDDTSRLGRDMPEMMKLIDEFKFRKVFVSAVSQGIDSAQDSSRQLFALNSMMDEQYLVGLADKVHRGQEGRALKGLNPGGKCFGYRNVPLENPARLA